MNKYINERKKLYEYFIKNSNAKELEEWEEFVKKIEKNLEEEKWYEKYRNCEEDRWIR